MVFGNNKKKTRNDALKNLSQLNPFARGSSNTFGGAGQSLGGTQPGTVIPISLCDPGPLGVKVEKRPNTEGTAIVFEVIPGSQAEAAGLKRGDILCFRGSDGQDEMHYDIFLDMARSEHRPLELEVRRILTTDSKSATTGSMDSSTGPSPVTSAEADHRKQAVIAAAEAREKANKAKQKPIKQVTKTTLAKQQQLLQQSSTTETTTIDAGPLSEEAKRAAAEAKLQEARLAEQLGYNPYETARATAGQARTATVAVQHGTIDAGASTAVPPSAAPTGTTSTALHAMTSPGVIAPPVNAMVPAGTTENDLLGPPPEVEETLAAFFSSTSSSYDSKTFSSTCNIMKTLIVNATTKGQQGGSATNDDDDAGSKFRKVRLANPKIKAALVDVACAIDVMMAVGFILQEQDGESFLIYPKGGGGGPRWLPILIQQLESVSTAHAATK